MELSDGMDIVGYSTMNAQNEVMAAVSVNVLKQTLDMQEMMGAEMVQMMEQSVNPHLGGNVDILV